MTVCISRFLRTVDARRSADPALFLKFDRVRDQPVTSHPVGAPGRRASILALVSSSLIIIKLEDHDIRAPILGMGREVAISRRIPVLVKATTNRHDLPRTALLDPLLDQVNCVREPADEGCVVPRQQWT